MTQLDENDLVLILAKLGEMQKQIDALRSRSCPSNVAADCPWVRYPKEMPPLKTTNSIKCCQCQTRFEYDIEEQVVHCPKCNEAYEKAGPRG